MRSQSLTIRKRYESSRTTPKPTTAGVDALQGLGRFEESITHYQEATRIQPGYAKAHNNWGAALQRLQRPEDAMVHYAAALRIRPDYAGVYNNLGTIFAEKGHLMDAIKHFEHAVRLKPDLDDARNNLRRARALLQQQHGPIQP